jgi:hypothetical protein
MGCRAGLQQGLSHGRGGRNCVLAIVEHEQKLLPAACLRYALRRDRGAKPDRSGDRAGNKIGIGKRRQVSEPHPISKVRQQLMRDRHREPRLANAAGAGQRDESMLCRDG